MACRILAVGGRGSSQAGAGPAANPGPVEPVAAPVRPASPRVAPVVLAVAGLLLAMVAGLRGLGRLGWCACGSPGPWAGDVWSSHNSQHLLDPYSFTHFLHGLGFYFLLWAVLRHRVSVRNRGVLAVGLEALWELFENTPFVIGRYRAATASLDYAGDTVANSLGDVLSCALGYLVAATAPVWTSALLFVGVEAVLLLWIRDSLLLNVWMLLAPSEALKRWQMGVPPHPPPN